jgi:hypothetical protein
MISKHLLRGDRDATVRRIDLEIDHFAARLRSPEARAAFAAFMNKDKA